MFSYIRIYIYIYIYICIVYNSVKCVHYSRIIIFVTLIKFIAHFVNSPLNSYLYIHLILDFKYILLLIF